MTIADIPRLPDADIIRLKQLVSKVKNKELPFAALLENGLAAMGRFEISSDGIRIADGLALGPSAIQVFTKAAEASLDLFPKVFGKSIFLDIKDVGVFKVRMGLPPKVSAALPGEADAMRAPVLWLNLSVLPSFFQGLEGAVIEEDEEFWRFRRFEVLLDWLGGGWTGFTASLGAMLPFLALTTRETLENIQKPLTSLVKDVLARCGV